MKNGIDFVGFQKLLVLPTHIVLTAAHPITHLAVAVPQILVVVSAVVTLVVEEAVGIGKPAVHVYHQFT